MSLLFLLLFKRPIIVQNLDKKTVAQKKSQEQKNKKKRGENGNNKRREEFCVRSMFNATTTT
jgi:hypothetical protein